MAAISILPLHTINVAGTVSWIKSNQRTVASIGKIGDMVSTVPGVGSIKSIIAKELARQIDKLVPLTKGAIKALLLKALRENLMKVPWEQFVKPINKIIKAINKIIDLINSAIDILKALLAPVFAIIIVLTIAYVIAKVITLIPSFGGGWGFVVTATSPGTGAGLIATACEKLLLEIKPIPGSVLAGLLQLLSLMGFMSIISLIVNLFMSKQNSMSDSAISAANKTADDWANSSEVTDENYDTDNLTTNLNDSINSLLSRGDGDSLVDNMIERLSINGQINNIEKKLNGMGVEHDNLGDCKFATGEIKKLTPEDCLEQGGQWGYGSPPDNPPSPPSSPYSDAQGNVWAWIEPPGEWQLVGGPNYEGISDAERKDLLLMKNALGDELNNLGGALSNDELASVPPELIEQVTEVFDGLGTDMITSLLNPDQNVTVEEATKNFGTRYGFYQQETTGD